MAETKNDSHKSCESPNQSSIHFESTQSTILKSSLKLPIIFSPNILTKKLSSVSSDLYKNQEKVIQASSPSVISSDSQNSIIEEAVQTNSLFVFLKEINLVSLFKVFTDQGYDDYSFLLDQMRTEPFTLQKLEEIGIKKIGNRMILLAHLEERCYCRNSIPVKSSCCSKQLAEPAADLKDWLQKMSLLSLHKLLIENGFEDLPSMLFLMNSSYPITDEVLQIIGIRKIGYRQRLLLRLLEETNKLLPEFSADSERKSAACSNCLIS